ncbi:hypothetical protein GCM10010094_89070 [Streptomyces flaveus]|uniref:Uncharacterized protein n=1 Tax=Streptomyces flaveus TaxID=66370 RepID=A0A917RMA2_9ACTN|nr:hypothetical protein GCM10010094_89070 [Streptomyces flaveus]
MPGWAKVSIAVVALVAAVGYGAGSGSDSSNPREDRDTCRESYEGVGDDTVDWRGMCDVPGYVEDDR